jgi:small-conductance mechanosensitive channel
MYFKSPDQLLSMMAWLEAQNMSLMQHCQDAEHLVERYFTRFEQMLRARDGAISEKQEELKRRKAAFRESQGITEGFHWGNELSEAELRELQAAISKFDIELGFDSTKSIDTVTMLTRIENVMEKLRLRLAKLDPRLLQEKLQRKAFERKDEESAARILLEQREQDEKAQRTIQQAMMGIKEKTGRPVVHRMLPIFMPDRELSDLEYRRKQERAAADADLLYGDLWD